MINIIKTKDLNLNIILTLILEHLPKPIQGQKSCVFYSEKSISSLFASGFGTDLKYWGFLR